MRKLLITVVSSIITLAAYGHPVTPAEATIVASDFFKTKLLKKRVYSSVPQVIRVANPKADSTSVSPFYVFNIGDENGFIIVSGDDRAKKIIGYSNNGKFDFNNIPSQLAAVLDSYAKKFLTLSSSEVKDSSWDSSKTNTSESDGIILNTPNWGQFQPYNNKCSELSGIQCPTGCVATAMAIALKYNSWPDTGRGKHATYDGKHQYNFENGMWNWQEIDTGNDEDSLADIMYACGVAVDMDYSETESGAFPYAIPYALRQYFRMSQDCQYVTRGNFSEEDWNNMMREQIEKNQPFIFSANENRHTWIIDGFDGNGLFHCNWGWEGVNNGYYDLNEFTEKFDGICINIIPDNTDSEISPAYMDYGYGSTWGKEIGISVNVSDISQGIPFKLKASPINFRDPFLGEIGVALTDESGNIKEIVYHEYKNINGLASFAMFADNLAINQEVSASDRLQLVTRKADSEKWLNVIGSKEVSTSIPCKGNIVNECVINITVGAGAELTLNGEFYSEGKYTRKVNCGDYLSYSYNYLNDDERKVESMVVYIDGEAAAYDYFYTPYNQVPTTRAYVGGMYVVPDLKQSVDFEVSRYQLIESIATDNDVAGELHTILLKSKAASVKKLKISGFVNAEDILYIRQTCVNLETIDLSEVTICETHTPTLFKDLAVLYGMQPQDISPADYFPDFAFSNICHITLINLPSNLKAIGFGSFLNTYISSIDIPADVSSIGLNAFDACINLYKVIVHNAPVNDVAHCGFSQGPSYEDGVLFVPRDFLDDYKSHDVWSLFTQIVPYDGENDEIFKINSIENDGVKYRVCGLELSVSEITDNAPSILKLPLTVNYSGYDFKVVKVDANVMKTSNVEEIHLCDGIRSLSVGSFRNAWRLKKVLVNEGIKILPQQVFDGAISMEYISLPNSLEEIHWMAFNNCNSLKELRIPAKVYKFVPNEGLLWNITTGEAVNGLLSLERYVVDAENKFFTAKDGCLYSKDYTTLFAIPGSWEGEFTISSTVTRLGDGFAKNCRKITKMTLSSGVSSLPNYAFENTSNLQSLYISSPNMHFGRCIFYYSGIKDIILEKGVKDISIESDPIDIMGDGQILNFIIETPDKLDFTGKLYNRHRFFSASLNPSIISNNHDIYIPGKAKTDNISSESRIHELWNYDIDKTNGLIKIEPCYEDVEINDVEINGIPAEYVTSTYSYDINSPDLNVKVNYTLNNRHMMTTFYSTQFNAELPGSIFTGIYGPKDDNAEIDYSQPYDIFNLQGLKISGDISEVPSGIYILRQDSTVRKIRIR